MLRIPKVYQETLHLPAVIDDWEDLQDFIASARVEFRGAFNRPGYEFSEEVFLWAALLARALQFFIRGSRVGCRRRQAGSAVPGNG